MVDLYDIRYVRIGTANLSQAIEFATRIVGLQLVRREGKSAYFRSDNAAARGDAISRERTAYLERPEPYFATYGPKTRRKFLLTL